MDSKTDLSKTFKEFFEMVLESNNFKTIFAMEK